jgi:predicted TIM-barrel fold metal-dependent hydrolase
MTAWPELPIVDAHAHVYTVSMPAAPDAWRKVSRGRPVSEFLETLDANHVPFGVIAAASMYGDYNDYTLAALREHPRLRGTVIVAPTVDAYTLREMKKEGVVGVRWVWFVQKDLPDLKSAEYRKFLARLTDLDLHVELLLGGERLAPVLADLQPSGVKVVIDHFGFPDPQLGTDCPAFNAALRSVENGRTWIKLAAYHRLGNVANALTQRLVGAAGTERLVWGSDWPFVAADEHYTYQQAIDSFIAAVPDAGTRRAISETALRLYFWS